MRNSVMSKFEVIQRDCLKRGELFEDPDFPANQASVFYHQTPPFEFVWKRPQDLTTDPLFIQDDNGDFDIVPGKLGDRWLVSCFGCLYLTPGLFSRIIMPGQNFDDNYIGLFRFRFWWGGTWMEVIIDDRLPTVNNKLVFIHTAHSNQYWAALLEKAYAKLHGSYEALKYGSTLDGLADLTGGVTESIESHNESSNSNHVLNKLLEKTTIITCIASSTHNSQVRGQIEKLPNGILLGIAYRVLGVEKVETISGNIINLVNLICPYSNAHYSGSWSHGSKDWNDISVEEKDRIELNSHSCAEFWMPYFDFVKTFSNLEITHLDSDSSTDEPMLHKKRAWEVKVWEGRWQKGVTAGGCRNHSDTFHVNPQFLLTLNEPDEILISLQQHRVIDPWVIGFSVYQITDENPERLQKSFFKKSRSVFHSKYANSRQVTQHHMLSQGQYVLLPTTYEPGQEGTFTLRIYSSIKFCMGILDDIPIILKSPIIKAPTSFEKHELNSYDLVFLQLADEKKTVNAFELQDLLDACLPNDYIKSCASLEVCRLATIAMDLTGSGRLSFENFKDLMYSLKFWQGIFKSHSKGTNGILRSERLREGLFDVGFQVNTEIMSLLMLRYIRKDGTLRFGDFVSCILHLSIVFSTFASKDIAHSGFIKLSLSEWMKTALKC